MVFRFPDAFTERCATLQLLDAGYFSAHIVVGNTFGCPKAVEQFNAFYQKLTAQGLNAKPVLIGISRGGLYAYRWAAENPGKVGAIYGDAPVCDFKSWPAGKGKGRAAHKIGRPSSVHTVSKMKPRRWHTPTTRLIRLLGWPPQESHHPCGWRQRRRCACGGEYGHP